MAEGFRHRKFLLSLSTRATRKRKVNEYDSLMIVERIDESDEAPGWALLLHRQLWYVSDEYRVEYLQREHDTRSPSRNSNAEFRG